MNVAPKPEATPTHPGNYMSTCMVCNRTMMWADKRCRLCTDCEVPHSPGSRLMVAGDLGMAETADRCAQFQTALIKYGRHEIGCAAVSFWSDERGPCTCGLTALLAVCAADTQSDAGAKS